MITLSLETPLASLLDAARAEGRVDSLTALAKLAGRSEESLHDARRLGARIKLNTLASYAWAGRWTLVVTTDQRDHMGESIGARAEGLGATVADARGLIEGLGWEMTLTLVPAERSPR